MDNSVPSPAFSWLPPAHPALAPYDIKRFPWQFVPAGVVWSRVASATHVTNRCVKSKRKPLETPYHVDWLAFTIQKSILEFLCGYVGSDEMAARMVGQHLEGELGLSMSDRLGFGKYCYKDSANLVYPESVDAVVKGSLGKVMWGGNGSTVCVEITGEGCEFVNLHGGFARFTEWLEKVGAKLTRVDLAFDEFEGFHGVEVMRDSWDQGGFKTGGRNPRARLIDDLGSNEGKTLYVGSRAAGKLYRCYEKGKQLGGESSCWVRHEVELRPARNRVLPYDLLIDCGGYIAGYYPALEWINHRVQTVKSIVKKRVEIAYEAAVGHAKKVAGRLINVMMEIEGGRPDVVIRKLIRDGVPDRLIVPPLLE